MEKETKIHLMQRFLLNGTETLICQRPIPNVTGEGKWVTEAELPLKEVTESELFELRLKGKPCFLLKKDGHYYYTPIEKSLRIFANMGFGKHACANCDRLSPAKDCDGGCAKVRDRDVQYLMKEGKSLKDSVTHCKRIEKYVFILKGYETFNTDLECFGVFECTHHQKADRKPIIPPEGLNNARMGLEELADDFFYSTTRDTYSCSDYS